MNSFTLFSMQSDIFGLNEDGNSYLIPIQWFELGSVSDKTK